MVNKPCIFIDAGHNYAKWNTGAERNGLREQDITFYISKKLYDKLTIAGFDVKLSRERITDILGTNNSTSLTTRTTMANNWGADLFISIHCNSHITPTATGTETLVYSEKSSIYNLAKNINNAISKNLSLKKRGVKPSPNLTVLKKTMAPALLVETAFISNVNDAQKLKDRQDDFAEIICNEICAYYGVKKGTTNEANPVVGVPEPAKYHIEGTTHVIEIDPRNIFAVETQCSTKSVKYNNFVNSVFFMRQGNGIIFPQGMIVNAGQVMSNYMTHGKPVATLIIHSANDVEMKYVSDISKEKDVWFAISGYGIYPNITNVEEGFTKVIENGKEKDFSDVTRTDDRPIIGYRKKDNKIVIAVRANSNAKRAQQTAKNLGLDFAISLDGGGSTTLKVDGKYKFKGDGRKIYGGLIWC